MISRETAAKIWNAYREIEAAEKLLIKVEETVKDFETDNSLPSLKDISREARRFEFGVPSGENSHRLFGVSPTLAEAVIREHIDNKKEELLKANEQARIEFNQD